MTQYPREYILVVYMKAHLLIVNVDLWLYLVIILLLVLCLRLLLTNLLTPVSVYLWQLILLECTAYKQCLLPMLPIPFILFHVLTIQNLPDLLGCIQIQAIPTKMNALKRLRLFHALENYQGILIVKATC